MEAYRQIARMGPTVIIGDFNAAPSMDDCGGRQTPDDTAVQMAMQHTGLHDLTTSLRGQLPHRPPQSGSTDSGIDLCYADPGHLEVTRARYHDLPSQITGHRPLEVQMRVLQVPPASTEDVNQGKQPIVRPGDDHDTHRWTAYYRMVRRIMGEQEEKDLNLAMRRAATACGLQGGHRHTQDSGTPHQELRSMVTAIWRNKRTLHTAIHSHDLQASTAPRTLPHDWTPHARSSGSGTSAERGSWHKNSNATLRTPSPTSR